MKPQKVNARMLDAQINHQIDLQHAANGVVRKVMALLNRADADLFARLNAALETMPADSFTVQRLEGLLVSVRELNSNVYDRVRIAIENDMRELAMIELEFQGKVIGGYPPVRIPLAAVDSTSVWAAVTARPFQGRLLREWAISMGEAKMVRIRDTLRIGYINGETIGDMVRRLRGTKAKGYSDGIIEIDRRSAEAVVRTATSHTAAVARDAMYAANADVIKAIQWASTLDTRTTEICRVRDGLRYTCTDHRPIGHSVPWLGGPGAAHWNCRSTAVPILKSWEELGVDAAEFPPGVRASMDGEVPADMTYAEWFGRQSAERQDQIVGPTRGRAFRAGNVTFASFTNDRGRWLTLQQLRDNGLRV